MKKVVSLVLATTASCKRRLVDELRKICSLAQRTAKRPLIDGQNSILAVAIEIEGHCYCRLRNSDDIREASMHSKKSAKLNSRVHYMKGILLTLLVCVAGTALAQPYPNRPITMIVPFAPGGTSEVLGRQMGAKMSEYLGQPIVIEPRPGAGGAVGAEYVARRARNDGYTILFAGSNLATHVSLMKLPFDPVKDLAPVAGIAAIPSLAVVSTDSPIQSMKDLVAAAKKSAGAVTFGSSGPGTGSHLAGELFKAAAGVDITHVPYKSTGTAYPDVIASRVTALFDVLGGSALGMVRGGKVRAIGISSSKRTSALPDVPTIAEQGYPGFEFVTWVAFFAPAGTPTDAIVRLEKATEFALQTPEVKDRLAQIAAEPIPVPTAAFSSYYHADVERWARLVREGKLKPLE